jgi:hypothetical protein
MYKYKVIWFDDEYPSLNIIREKAFLNDIELIGFGNAMQGIEELEKNIKTYDAAIIDGLFFLNSDQSGTPSSDKAMFDVAVALERLSSLKKLPWFILSGQVSFTKEKNRYADGLKENQVYDKLNDDHLGKLWQDIKIEANKQIETQIRLKYRRAFEVCTEKYIGEVALKHLLDIVINTEYPNETFDDEKYFNGLRKVIEYVFRASNRLGLLHDKCIPNGIVNLTWASLFMSNRELELKPSTERIGCLKIHFPSVLGRNIKSILDITSAASHTEAEREIGKLNFSEYKKNITSNYLLYSLTFQVMDLLIWFKKYADENPDREKNKLLWQSSISTLPAGEWIKGKITVIADNGYGTFQPSNGGRPLSIIPSKVKEYNLSSKQTIEVTTKQDNTGTKTFIENIRIV